MFTGNIEYSRQIYKVDKVLKSYTVFRLVSVVDSKTIKLGVLVRLEPFRGKSNSTGANRFLRSHNGNKWADKTITGLRPTEINNVFYGDHNNGQKNLLLFQFSKDGEHLVIDYFNGFYPFNPTTANELISNHSFLY